MEVVNSVERETKVQVKEDIIKKKNDALGFVNGDLIYIKKRKKEKGLSKIFL